MADEQGTGALPSVAASLGRRMAARHVLLVEDDPSLREVYAEVLRDEGWTVHSAGDGVEALQLLSDGADPCVAVLDLRMPRMDGWELTDRLRDSADWRDLPIVVVAAHYRVQEEARRLGTRWWLQKPVDIGRLVEVVTDACTTRSAA